MNLFNDVLPARKKIKMYYDNRVVGSIRDRSFISIGLISESGAKFYAEFTDYQIARSDNNHMIENLILGSCGPIFRYQSHAFAIDDSRFKHWNMILKDTRENISKELCVWLENEAHMLGDDADVRHIQFCINLRTFDWMLLLSLLIDSKDESITNIIHPLPYDVSTLMQSRGIEPLTSFGPTFVYDDIPYLKEFVDGISHHGFNFSNMNNSLWDAAILMATFEMLENNSGKDLFKMAFNKLFNEDIQ